jgi:hypothetical protein
VASADLVLSGEVLEIDENRELPTLGRFLISGEASAIELVDFAVRNPVQPSGHPEEIVPDTIFDERIDRSEDDDIEARSGENHKEEDRNEDDELEPFRS